LGLGTIVLVVIVILVILAIIGLGWQGFFGGVKKGADKLGITSLVTNLTDQFKNELSKRVGNITS
jgi:Tfp pilus assembly protein PilO